MRSLLMLIIFLGVESRRVPLKESLRNIRHGMTSQENNQMSNKVIPVVNENMLFDTRTLDQEALRELLKDPEPIDDSLRHLDEESSGDFEPTNKWTAQRSQSQEPNTNPSTTGKTTTQMKTKKCNERFMCENGWIHYKYEKSFILVNRTATREEAEKICQSFNENEDLGVELAVPQSDEEMAFLNHYMFNMSHCLKNVWIGQNTDNFRVISTHFTLYSNWAKGMPTLTKPCVQIRSPLTIYADMDGSIGGKWEDVACYRKNLVLCQKPQHWSHHQVIRVLTKLKKDVEDFKQKSGKDTIPVGFIYIQLPKQLAPKELWPMYSWKDVSYFYSGLFFRVLGGKSGPFGHIQDATAPRLAFKSYGTHGIPPGDLDTHELKADNEWSDNIKDHGFPVSFLVSDDDVVPRNTPIITWKRI